MAHSCLAAPETCLPGAGMHTLLSSGQLAPSAAAAYNCAWTMQWTAALSIMPQRLPSLHRVQLTSLGLRSVEPATQAKQTVAPIGRRVSRPWAHFEQLLLV